MTILSKQFFDYLSTANPAMLEILNKGFEANKVAGEEYNRLNRMTKRAEIFDAFIKEAAENEPVSIKEINYSVLPSDAFIADEMFKMAGFDIHDTTPEGIEQFLKEYFYNELSFFPDRLNISVTLVPLDVAPVNPKQYDMNINNATGTVDINYNNAVIQIPFILRDKEILPFDTIQMGNETAVYTRDNMRNILLNLKQLSEKRPDAGLLVNETKNINGYIGVDKHIGVTTDSGFMGDMLQIQSLLGQNSAPNYVHAALVDEFLEKTAAIKKVNFDYDKLELEVKKQIMPEAVKLAAMEYQEDEAKALEKQAFFSQLDNEVVADVQILDNGDYFVFTEKDGSIVTETVGILFKEVTSINQATDQRLVLTADGRYKLLAPGEGFIFNLTRTNSLPPLNLKTTVINKLNPGRAYTANINDNMLVPFVITKAVSGGEFGIKIPVLYHCTDIKGHKFTLMPAAGVGKDQIIIKNKEGIMGIAAQKEDPSKLPIYNTLFTKKEPIVCLAEDVALLELKRGEIHNITSRKDMMFLFDGNVKLASFGDKVILVLVDGSIPLFNIITVWTDNRSGMDRRIELNNVDKNKAVNALKTIGFDFDAISQLIYQTTKEGYAEKGLGIGNYPWKLEPDVSASMAAVHTVQGLKDSLFTGKNLRDAFATLTGSVLGGLLSGTKTGEQVSEMGVFASESKALAEKLEKIAMAKESGTFTKLAGLMVIKNRLDNLFSGVMQGGEYVGTDALNELHELDPYMSKLAYDLVELKLAQAFHKDEIISPNVINATLRHLDQLHKYAKAFA